MLICDPGPQKQVLRVDVLAEMQLFGNLRVQKTFLNIEKITYKVVQMKFLAMHITNQKLSFDIFTVGN